MFSQSLYSFTFNAVIVIHEYIYSHSTTEFSFKKYIYSQLPVYFLFSIIFTHIYEMSSFTFNVLYSFTFTIEIFIQHFLRTTFEGSPGFLGNKGTREISTSNLAMGTREQSKKNRREQGNKHKKLQGPTFFT